MGREVPVTFAGGVREDVASLVARSDDEASAPDIAALKRRVAEQLVECKANPYLGEPMGSGRHPGLAGCRFRRLARSSLDCSMIWAGRRSPTETSSS